MPAAPVARAADKPRLSMAMRQLEANSPKGKGGLKLACVDLISHTSDRLANSPKGIGAI